MKPVTVFRAVCLCGFALSQSFAWGPNGHMVVAAVAWQRLRPEVRAEASRLLRENPYYDRWVAGVPEADRDAVAFVKAALWPDDIKGDDDYDNSEGNHPKKGAKSGQNIGYTDFLQHRYWHFYDTPYSLDGVKTRKPDKFNALTQILLFTKALKASSDDSVRSYDLTWLIHMVGDVHQPLHAATRFDKKLPGGDGGGNLIKICTAAQMKQAPSKCSTKLYGVWDGMPGSDRGPEAAIAQASHLPAPDDAEARIADPATWIDQSFQLARDTAYHDLAAGPGPFVLDAVYRSGARDLADARMALAGARLANLINDNLAIPH